MNTENNIYQQTYDEIKKYLAQYHETSEKNVKKRTSLYNKAYKLLVKALIQNNQIVLHNLKEFEDLPKYNKLYGKNLFFYVIQHNSHDWAKVLFKNNQIDTAAVTDYGYNYIQMAIVHNKMRLLKFIVENALVDDLTFRSASTAQRDMSFEDYYKKKNRTRAGKLISIAPQILERRKILESLDENIANKDKKKTKLL